MKKITLFILILNIFLFHLGSHVVAQQKDLYLAITEFNNRDDMDILFANSTKALKYYAGVEVNHPTFISLISEDQKNILTQKGFLPKIIDTNPDLSHYFELEVLKPNQESLITQYNIGTYWKIPSSVIILKASTYGILQLDRLEHIFFVFPFPKNEVLPPKFRTKKTIVIPTAAIFSPTQIPADSRQAKNNTLSPLLIVLSISITIVGI